MVRHQQNFFAINLISFVCRLTKPEAFDYLTNYKHDSDLMSYKIAIIIKGFKLVLKFD